MCILSLPSSRVFPMRSTSQMLISVVSFQLMLLTERPPSDISVYLR